MDLLFPRACLKFLWTQCLFEKLALHFFVFNDIFKYNSMQTQTTQIFWVGRIKAEEQRKTTKTATNINIFLTPTATESLQKKISF